MNIAILKYNAGNNFSVQCALKRIGYEAVVTDNPDIILNADRVIRNMYRLQMLHIIAALILKDCALRAYALHAALREHIVPGHFP